MSAESTKICILHTNDIHSQFQQMPKIAAVFADFEQRYKADSLLKIDCGDHMDRMRKETEGTQGLANIRVMNAAGYEYAVLGNNEGLTFSIPRLEQLYTEYAHFQVLGNNMKLKSTGERPHWMLPYDIVNKGNVNIGLIGSTVNFSEFYERIGWEVVDPIREIRASVEALKEKVDLIVMISHLGIRTDERLAAEIDGIHLIIGAHTHHLIEEPLLINDTYICAAGKYGEYVGAIELMIDVNSSHKRIRSIQGKVISADTKEQGEAFTESLIEHSTKEAEQYLNTVVARIPASLSSDWYLESDFGNLLAAGLREWTNSEIGIVNSGQLLRSLNTGTVSLGQLLAACPSPINPCSMDLSGEEIRVTLEQSLQYEYQHMPIKGFGFRGERLGMLNLDGLTVEYDVNLPVGEQIKSVFIGDQLLQSSKVYRVGTITMFTFGIGYLLFKNGKNIQYYLPEFLRDVLQSELKKESSLKRCKQRNWVRL